jgi:UDP-4-amino-4,6-dideoxy-N-acetyl-beta-L-altrosamine N-acetyltransferase
MKKRRIILRADGNNASGLGHIYRMIGLAEILSPLFECIFVTREPMQGIINEINNSGATLFAIDGRDEERSWGELITAHHIVVTDGYQFGNDYHLWLKSKGCVVIHMEDIFSQYQNADILINPVPGVDLSDYPGFHGALAAGPGYAPLRSLFRLAAKKDHSKSRFMLITMGGSDAKELSVKFINLMLDIFPGEEITILTGAVNQNLKQIQELSEQNKFIVHRHDLSADDVYDLYKEHRFALLPSSVSCFEAIACGCHIITGYYARNQERFNSWIAKHKVGLNIGDLEAEVSSADIKRYVADPLLFLSPEKITELRSQLARAGENLVQLFQEVSPAKVKDRVIDRTMIYSIGNYHLQNFITLDIEMQKSILSWRNHEDIRSWMFNENEISLEDHLKFVKNLEHNDQNFYWIVRKDEKTIGVAYLNHYDERENTAQWGFYTNPEYFNSFAGLEIAYAALWVFTEKLGIKNLRSYVRESNARAMLLNEFFGMEHFKWVVVGNKKYSYRQLAQDQITNHAHNISSVVKSFSVFLKNKKVLT